MYTQQISIQMYLLHSLNKRKHDKTECMAEYIHEKFEYWSFFYDVEVEMK